MSDIDKLLEAVDGYLERQDSREARDLLQRVRLALDPDLRHEAEWEPGITGVMTMSYRPTCPCGWKGSWYSNGDPGLRTGRELAEAAGKKHVEASNA